MIEREGILLAASIKDRIRRERLELRSRIGAEDHSARSRHIIHQVITSDEYVSSQRVLAYVSIRNEVSTADLLLHVLDSGKSLYLPRVIRGHRELEIVKVSNLTSDLSVGTFGIPEPVATLAAADQSEIEDIGLAAIPGVAFDSMGYRLGYGAGYYDRFMSRLSAGCLSIGVCFEEQLMAELPRDPWDIPVKRVIAG